MKTAPTKVEIVDVFTFATAGIADLVPAQDGGNIRCSLEIAAEADRFLDARERNGVFAVVGPDGEVWRIEAGR